MLTYLFENYIAKFQHGINFVETFTKYSILLPLYFFPEEVLITQDDSN